MKLEYVVDSWRGHPNTHCPFCSFATTSDNAVALVDGHVAAVHPVQLREAIAADMDAQLTATRQSMNKGQLLELAESIGAEGLSIRNTRDQIEAAIAAAQEATAAAALSAPEDA